MYMQCGRLLRGQCVLVVEDSHLVADKLADVLQREGAEVVGPVSTLADAQRLASERLELVAAVLDVNIRGEMVWPVADLLASRHVRLVFTTGYMAALIKERYSRAKIAEKPAPAHMVARLLSVEPFASHG